MQTRMVGREAELEVLCASLRRGDLPAPRPRRPRGRRGGPRQEPAARRVPGCAEPADLLAAARPRPSAQRDPPVRPAARHAGAPVPDRRGRPGRGRAPQAPRRAGAAVRRRRRGADPSARPADRPRLLGQPACAGSARRRSAVQGARLRGRRAVPAPPRREPAGRRGARRSALVRSGHARLHAPSAGEQRRHAAARRADVAPDHVPTRRPSGRSAKCATRCWS